METKARHVIVGLFTLAVILAGFLFVYWLENSGGFGRRTLYRVEFASPVGGLLVGSAVEFNGVRVGEVTSLELVADQPALTRAVIAVDPSAPVRADTRVGIAFQGLSGAPAVSLTGGSGSEVLVAAGGGMPLLTAEPMAGQSVAEAAKAALGRIDRLFGDNTDDIGITIKNLRTFTDAFARNSDRIDGIMQGLEKMVGSSKGAAEPAYELGTSGKLADCAAPAPGVLVVPEPTASFTLNADRVVLAAGAGGSRPSDIRWTDNLAVMMQGKLVQSFEASGCFGRVSRSRDDLRGDHQVAVEIRNFRADPADSKATLIDLAVNLLNAEGGIVGQTVVSERAPLASERAVDIIASFDSGFRTATAKLIRWSRDAIAAEPPPPAPDAPAVAPGADDVAPIPDPAAIPEVPPQPDAPQPSPTP